MADQEISSLPDAAALTGAELMHLIQAGNSRKDTIASISTAWFPALSGNAGQMLVVNPSEDDFILQDQYPSFTGNAGRVLAVNVGETDVEFISAATYPSFTGNAGNVLAVNITENGVEWVTPASGSSTTHIEVTASRNIAEADLAGGVVLWVTSASAVTLTIPSSLTNDEPCVVIRAGTGAVDIQPGGGVTLNSPAGDRFIEVQHGQANIIPDKTAILSSETYQLEGRLSAS